MIVVEKTRKNSEKQEFNRGTNGKTMEKGDKTLLKNQINRFKQAFFRVKLFYDHSSPEFQVILNQKNASPP